MYCSRPLSRNAARSSSARHALPVRSNQDRIRSPLPADLRRLLIFRLNHSDTARFPSRAHTFACLAHFHQHFGPLADAHVHLEPDTKRPGRAIEVVVPVRKADEALGQTTHTIHLPGQGAGLISDAFDESKGYQAFLADLIGPHASETPRRGHPTHFVVSVRLMEDDEKPLLNAHYHDPFDAVVGWPRSPDNKKPDLIIGKFAEFGGFTKQVP